MTAPVHVVDWDQPANDFLLVSQFSGKGALYTCRPDLVGFVNGLPKLDAEFEEIIPQSRDEEEFRQKMLAK